MHKIAALLPLLGWFYFSIVGLALGSAFFKKKYSFFVKMLWIPFICISCVGIVQINYFEILNLPKILPTLKDASTSKIDHYVGSYRTQYLQDFFSVIQQRNIHYVSLLDVDSRELHYARMYLYPAIVNSIPSQEKLPKEHKFVIVGLEKSEWIVAGRLLKVSQGKALLEMEGE